MKVDSPTPLTSLACSLIHLWIDGCLNLALRVGSLRCRNASGVGGKAEVPRERSKR
jgi:hypothetical protein